MRNRPAHLYVSLAATSLIAAMLSLAACGARKGSVNPSASNASTQAEASDGIRRISVEELQAALERGEAVLVDVRGGVEYDLGHIKGARSVPLGLIAEQAGQLPRDKLIVTYCACTHEQLSVRGAQEMKKQGIEKTAALVGGWNAWVEAGLPTEKVAE